MNLLSLQPGSLIELKHWTPLSSSGSRLVNQNLTISYESGGITIRPGETLTS
jgi:hypothetical protein